jgi:hypothetical protein
MNNYTIFNQLNDDTFSEESTNISDNESDCGDINNTNVSYYQDWINNVANIVYSELNAELADLPDENYRINYDAGLYAINMANIVINNYYNSI